MNKCVYCAKKLIILSNFLYPKQKKFCNDKCNTEFHKRKKREANAIKLQNSEELECLVCRTKFKTFQSQQIFCSNECKIDFHRLAAIADRTENRNSVTKICPICDKEFTPQKTLKETYCSAYCRKILGRKIYKMMRTCYEDTNTDKKNHAHAVLGYTPLDLLEHLQNFNNWEELKAQSWHLDHIFPIAAFIQHGIKDIKLICCLENLQPLSGKENMVKKGKYDEESFNNWLSKHQLKSTSHNCVLFTP